MQSVDPNRKTATMLTRYWIKLSTQRETTFVGVFCHLNYFCACCFGNRGQLNGPYKITFWKRPFFLVGSCLTLLCSFALFASSIWSRSIHTIRQFIPLAFWLFNAKYVAMKKKPHWSNPNNRMNWIQ